MDRPLRCCERYASHKHSWAPVRPRHPSDELCPQLPWFFQSGVSGFHAVIADIQSDLGNLAILAKEKSVDDVLQLTERLPLTANEASRIFGLDLEKILSSMWVSATEAEKPREFNRPSMFLLVLRSWFHESEEPLLWVLLLVWFTVGLPPVRAPFVWSLRLVGWSGVDSAVSFLMSFIWTMDKRFWIVQ